MHNNHASLLSICVCTKNNHLDLRKTVDSIITVFYLVDILVHVRDASQETFRFANIDYISQVNDSRQNIRILYSHNADDVNQYSPLNLHLFETTSGHLWFLHAGDTVPIDLSGIDLVEFLQKEPESLVIAPYQLHKNNRLRNVEPTRHLLDSSNEINSLIPFFLTGQPVCHQSVLIPAYLHKRFPYLVMDGHISADAHVLLMLLNHATRIAYYSRPLSIFDSTGVSSKMPLRSYLQMALPMLLLPCGHSIFIRNLYLIIQRVIVIFAKGVIQR